MVCAVSALVHYPPYRFAAWPREAPLELGSTHLTTETRAYSKGGGFFRICFFKKNPPPGKKKYLKKKMKIQCKYDLIINLLMEML